MSVLPAGWTDVNLGDIGVEAQSGFPSGKHNSEGVGIPHLRPMNVDRLGRIDLSEVKYVEPDRDLRLAAGDVLFNNTNSPALIGKTAYFDRIGDYAFSNHMTRLRVPEGIEPKYLAIQLHTMWMRGVFQRLCSHHVNQASVSATRLLAEVSLTIPPLNEQRRIVAAIEEHLSRLDAAAASLAAASARVRSLRIGMLVQALDGEWPSASVGDVAEVTSGPAFKSSSFRGPGEGIPLLRGENIEPGALRWRDTRTWPESMLDGYEHLFVESTDLILAMDRPVISTGLKLAPVRTQDLPALLVQRVARIRPSEGVLTEFLHAVLQVPRFIPHVIGDQTGTQLPHITLAGIRAFQIPLPPLEEQRRIVAEIEERLGAIDALRAAIERAQRRVAPLRRAVLERAFRGELVPQDPADEPASVLLDRIRAERAAAIPTRRPSRPRARTSTELDVTG